MDIDFEVSVIDLPTKYLSIMSIKYKKLRTVVVLHTNTQSDHLQRVADMGDGSVRQWQTGGARKTVELLQCWCRNGSAHAVHDNRPIESCLNDIFPFLKYFTGSFHDDVSS